MWLQFFISSKISFLKQQEVDISRSFAQEIPGELLLECYSTVNINGRILHS